MTSPCDPHEYDAHGNIDYGFVWSDEKQDYVPRPGPEAAALRARTGGELHLIEEERDRRFRP